MCRPYGICPHLLYQNKIIVNRLIRKCAAIIRMILMTAYPFNSQTFSIEQNFLSLNTNFPESKAVNDIVKDLLPLSHLQFHQIKLRFLLHDTPESKGLPPIEVLTGEESPGQSHDHGSTSDLQRSVIRNPFVWVLALSSAFMYVSRYAVNGWGVLFLQEVKGYSLALATQVISVNALLGIVGTVFSGWLSDTLFHGRRNVLAFGFGVLNTVALCLFLYSGDGILVNMLSMVLFGMAIGVLICFLGGLMAIDIVPREATGAALGIVGMASYIGAGLQDIVSGWLINEGKTVVDGVARYDFEAAALFWIAASALSFILALCVSKRSHI